MRLFSTSKTRRPARANWRATIAPAGPAPITIAVPCRRVDVHQTAPQRTTPTSTTPGQEKSARPASGQAHAGQARILRQLARFRQGERPGDRDWPVMPYDRRAAQQAAARPGQQITDGTTYEIIDQQQPAGCVRGLSQERARVSFRQGGAKTTSKSRHHNPRGSARSERREVKNRTDEASVPAACCWAKRTASALASQPSISTRRPLAKPFSPGRSARLPLHWPGRGRGSASRRPGSGQPFDRRPENRVASAQPVDPGQSAQGVRVLGGIKTRLVHQFRPALPLRSEALFVVPFH